MSYQLNTIANAFILRAMAYSTHDMTPMKLLKLVYIAHGWSLGINNQPLFVEKVEAWKYGPVIRDLYHHIKQYGNQPISKPLNVPVEEDIAQADKDLINRVWDVYGELDGLQLSSITHRDGSPWSKTWDARGLHGLTIEPDDIRAHYRDLVQQARANATTTAAQTN